MKNRGITLIALVITIIVLIILAGVTITSLTGNNGILSNALQAKEQTNMADERETLSIAALGAIDEDYTGEVTPENLKTELDKKISGKYMLTDEDGIMVTYKDSGRRYKIETDGSVVQYAEKAETGGKSFSTQYGTTEIVFLSGTDYVQGNPNIPEIDSTTMIPIKYNGTNWVVCSTSDPDWYNYEKQVRDTSQTGSGTSKWANVMLGDGTYKPGNVSVGQVIQQADLGSMFVWIPRYAYKICYFATQEDKDSYIANRNDTSKIVGYSDARGMVDTNGKVATGITTEQISTPFVTDHYRTHPVFDNHVKQGGWDKRLTGIWVGKFETTTTTSSLGANMVLPNKTSQIRIKLSEMFQKCQKIGTSLTMKLDSHLMKNSEWAATAYLAESPYGRNGTQITPNNVMYFTGYAGDSTNSSGSGTLTNSYETLAGQLASTTGNIYGVYDMNAGVDEYTMGFYQDTQGKIYTGYSGFNGYLSTEELKTDGITLPNPKYYQTFTLNNSTLLGQGIFETSTWYHAYGAFPSSNTPVLARGGAAANTNTSSLFTRNANTGNGASHGHCGFRVTLVEK